MFKIKNIVAILSILILVLIVGVGCVDSKKEAGDSKKGAGESKQGEKIKVKMVGTLPVGHHLTDAMTVFKKYVEEQSGGRVEVELYPAQQLYNDKDLVTVLPKGAVDMAIANLDMWTGVVPSVGLFYMPSLFQDEEHFFRVAHGEAGEMVKKQMEEKANCKFLGWIDYGTADMIFKDPVVKLEDFKGKRMRAYGQIISYYEEALGAAPTMMSSGEVYQALQKGMLDGAMSGLTSFNSRKWYEVAKHVPDVSVAPVVPFATLANINFWNSLPDDLKKIFMEGAAEVEKFTREAEKKDTMESRKVLENNGVIFDKITPEELERWRKATVPIMMEKFSENYDKEKAKKMFECVEALRK
ncbi:TRAP transporter substrate-binding protein DctP [Desulfallas sp. Bu1-1]|uniref:TRAP transporter substrate-binding protein n=1 Tax=Desulfallas sp. Bu1-1 TaxID=2787620 RepID=UPI00189CEF99|nr:TRAP transporter substrate-binding protein DctP [Desulfallas sp. Bu1-1]MBF7084517.1 TRAP transporter substrate-binding protein DctP [Desulfallas sp. Bu1-1]